MAGEEGWILVKFKVKLSLHLITHPLFLLPQQPPMGQGFLIHEVSRSHSTTDHSR